METDRISSLHTSCLGFAPLIFDLKESGKERVDFDQLMNACDPVWKAVETDQMLPRKLVKQPNYRMKPFNCFPTEHLLCLYLCKTCFTSFGIPLLILHSLNRVFGCMPILSLSSQTSPF